MKIGKNYITAPRGYTMTPISIFSRVAISVVPNNSIPNCVNDIQRIELGSNNASKATCSCTNGTCVIESHSVPFVGSLSFCKGDCSGTCTLSSGIISDGIYQEMFKATSYKF